MLVGFLFAVENYSDDGALLLMFFLKWKGQLLFCFGKFCMEFFMLISFVCFQVFHLSQQFDFVREIYNRRNSFPFQFKLEKNTYFSC